MGGVLARIEIREGGLRSVFDVQFVLNLLRNGTGVQLH